MKSQEFAQLLQTNINNGLYSETGKLPTEDMLMKQYGVTRYCVRGAVNLLVSLGEVYPVQGSGMFVRESKREGCLSLNNTTGLTAGFDPDTVVTRVLALDLEEADAALAKRMKCPFGTPIYALKRLRIVDGEPYAVEYSYYAKSIVHILNREIAEGSLYRYIREDLALNIGFADKVVYAEKLNADDAALLNLSEGDPTLIAEDDAYLSNGQMFNASKMVYHYQKVKFFNLANLK